MLLTDKSEEQLRTMVNLMMEMNSHKDQRHAFGCTGTYGHLQQAIIAFIEFETMVNLRNVNWNMGGAETFTDDILDAIERAIDYRLDIAERELEREYINGNYKIQVFSQDYRTGEMWIIYKIYFKGDLVFWGGDIGLPVGHDIKSDSTLGAILTLTEHRGEGSYHTPAQLEFLEQHSDELAQIGMELGDPGDLS